MDLNDQEASTKRLIARNSSSNPSGASPSLYLLRRMLPTEGSAASAVFLMVKIAIAVGILSFPQSLQHLSLVFGTLIMLLVLATNYLTYYLIACITNRTKSFSFSATIKSSLGENASIFYNCCVIFNVFVYQAALQLICKPF